MIELERHIEILLLNNDCVIVPSLGGFMAHHVDARYDERDDMFLPPMRTLGFNPLLKMNDSLLAQSYIEAYDISYPEALKRIENEISEINQYLESTGSYELNDIGTLFLNDNGHIEFNPCESGILTPELYGLGGFEISKLADTPQLTQEGTLQNIENVVTEVTDTKNATVKKSANDIIESHKTIESEDIHYEEDDEAIKIPIGVIRYIVAAAAAILLFFVLTSPIANSEIEGITQSSIKNGILFNILGESTAKSSKEKPLTLKVVKTAKEMDTKAVKTTPDNEKSTELKNNNKEYYCLVLASKVTKTNAEIFVKEMKSKGFDQTKIYQHHNTVKVVYGCYDSESKAYIVLNELHNKADEFKDSWVYKVRQ